MRGRLVHPLLKAYELFCSTSNGDVTSCLSSPMRLEDAGVGARYFCCVECLFIHNGEVEVHLFRHVTSRFRTPAALSHVSATNEASKYAPCTFSTNSPPLLQLFLPPLSDRLSGLTYNVLIYYTFPLYLVTLPLVHRNYGKR